MNKKFNFICILLILLIIKIVNSQFTIKINYNVERNYNSFEECGLINEPACTSFEDAKKKIILLYGDQIINAYSTFDIIGDINGSVPVSMGDLYGFCGRLYIKSENLDIPIKIDGSSSTQTFLTVHQPESYTPCQVVRTFYFRSIIFQNWDQTLIDINIIQMDFWSTTVTDLTKNDCVTVNFWKTNFISLSSIVKIYPKNINAFKRFSYGALSVIFTDTNAINLRSSNILAPNSTKDFLSPIFVIGAGLTSIPSVSNSTLLTTPFVYCKFGGILPRLNISITHNNFSVNPFFLVDGFVNNIATGDNFIFNDNVISTLFYITDFLAYISSPIKLSNTTQVPHYQRRTYLNYQYENSFIVARYSPWNDLKITNIIKYEIGSNNIIENDLFYVENGYMTVEFSEVGSPIPAKHFINTIDGEITLKNVNLTWDGLSVIGNNSLIYQDNLITQNDTYCGCYNCIVDDRKFNTSSIQCNDNTTPTNTPTDTPTNTPTDTPTNTPTDTPTNNPTDIPTETPTNTPTDTPTNTPTIPSETPITTTKRPTEIPEKSDRKRNIIIITIVLGVVCIGSLVIFVSIRYKNKRILTNTSFNQKINTENLNAGVEKDERDVSPNINLAVLYKHENEDRGQKEIL
ncbi:hypothetical protein ACTFIZ_001300 [Dictyostelium cf. discoideum]